METGGTIGIILIRRCNHLIQIFKRMPITHRFPDLPSQRVCGLDSISGQVPHEEDRTHPMMSGWPMDTFSLEREGTKLSVSCIASIHAVSSPLLFNFSCWQCR
jgi:hypothetical protein